MREGSVTRCGARIRFTQPISTTKGPRSYSRPYPEFEEWCDTTRTAGRVGRGGQEGSTPWYVQQRRTSLLYVPRG